MPGVPVSFTVKVQGLRELARACKQADEEIDRFLRDGLLEIASHTAADVKPPYAKYSQKGAAGVIPKVTKPGNAVVVQTLRKSRGLKRQIGRAHV